MIVDLTSIIGDWEYDSADDSKNVRKIIGQDGREKIQVRIRGGILQWEMHGRPDGTRPHGYESTLHYCHHLLENHRKEHGSVHGFALSHAQADAAGSEMVDYYQRRVVLFQLGEYVLAREDALHNLALMDFLKAHVSDPRTVQEHERYRPFVLMDRARADAAIRINAREYHKAIEMLDAGIREILEFYHDNQRDDLARDSQEIQILRGLKTKVREEYDVPLSPEEQIGALEEEKQQAIDAENYERAAQLRDQLAKLQTEHPEVKARAQHAK